MLHLSFDTVFFRRASWTIFHRWRQAGSVVAFGLCLGFYSCFLFGWTELRSQAPQPNLVAALTSKHGQGATSANIYMGLNAIHWPFAEVFVNVSTPGRNDAQYGFYQVTVEWVNVLGESGDPGGYENPPGERLLDSFPNDGNTRQLQLDLNYPSARSPYSYLRFRIYGLMGEYASRRSFRDYGSHLQSYAWNGRHHALLPVGPPPDVPARPPSLENVSAGPFSPKLSQLATQTTPTISVSSLGEFTYEIGGALPPEQSMTVTSSGTPLQFTAVSYQYTWLSVRPTWGVTPANISVSVAPKYLAEGRYRGAITFQSPDAANPDFQVPVDLVVRAQQPKPDLTITSLVAPSTGVVGANLGPVVTTVANVGQVASKSFDVGYYLSSGPAVSTADIETPSVCHFPSGLVQGAASSCTGTVSIPQNLRPGRYYLAAIIDPKNLTVESYKANNVTLSAGGPIELQAPAASLPDLSIQALIAPTTAVVGSPLSGILTVVENIGAGDAGSFRLEYYLASRPTVTTNDFATGSGCEFTGLAAGTVRTCSAPAMSQLRLRRVGITSVPLLIRQE
jgi:hypothetical protein